jgi:hypothetical protein
LIATATEFEPKLSVFDIETMCFGRGGDHSESISCVFYTKKQRNGRHGDQHFSNKVILRYFFLNMGPQISKLRARWKRKSEEDRMSELLKFADPCSKSGA